MMKFGKVFYIRSLMKRENDFNREQNDMNTMVDCINSLTRKGFTESFKARGKRDFNPYLQREFISPLMLRFWIFIVLKGIQIRQITAYFMLLKLRMEKREL